MTHFPTQSLPPCSRTGLEQNSVLQTLKRKIQSNCHKSLRVISVHHSTGEGLRGTELSLALPPHLGLGKTPPPQPPVRKSFLQTTSFFLPGCLWVWGLEACRVLVLTQPQGPV